MVQCTLHATPWSNDQLYDYNFKTFARRRFVMCTIGTVEQYLQSTYMCTGTTHDSYIKIQPHQTCTDEQGSWYIVGPYGGKIRRPWRKENTPQWLDLLSSMDRYNYA